MIFGNFRQSLVIFGDLWQYLSIFKSNLNYWKFIEINGNGLKLLEIDRGIGRLEFGSGVTRFPGVVLRGVGAWWGWEDSRIDTR